MNEILTRDLDSNPGTTGNNFTLAYNLRGDLEDEGGTGGYKYVYDAFGRLVEVRRQNNSLVAAYRYNGLNQRITWHYDADEDADVDGSDPVYHFCYDDKWRVIGVWRGADTDPKELFIYHNAGVAGYGGSSYIDSVVLRDRDMNGGGGWTGASDGTLETRHYYAQNWRADVSAIFDNDGAVVEWIKYSAYGVPFLLTPGDHNKDGVIDKADADAFDADYAANNARADLNKDGTISSADQTLFTASYNAAAVGGRWKLSAHVANRKGYAGYEHEGFGNDLAAPELAHVRHRVLHFGLGRWTRRDPAGYRAGMNLFVLATNPVGQVDPTGLEPLPCLGISCPGSGPGPSQGIPFDPPFTRPISLRPGGPPATDPEVPASPVGPLPGGGQIGVGVGIQIGATCCFPIVPLGIALCIGANAAAGQSSCICHNYDGGICIQNYTWRRVCLSVSIRPITDAGCHVNWPKIRVPHPVVGQGFCPSGDSEYTSRSFCLSAGLFGAGCQVCWDPNNFDAGIKNWSCGWAIGAHGVSATGCVTETRVSNPCTCVAQQ
ncbi:MAG: hypothetical protein KF699_16785 [Phycisphaeraceae bacterium]|nr:hypothetical protein [Phycisphaeraceae bacterium]